MAAYGRDKESGHTGKFQASNSAVRGKKMTAHFRSGVTKMSEDVAKFGREVS